MALGFVLLTAATSGCATQVSVPQARRLPEVRFIPPDNPEAVIALSADEEMNLFERDRLLRERIQLLQGLLAKP
jgi:hypothetical protein